MKIEDVEKYGLHAKGKNELIDYLQGKDITRADAITAKCYDCMGYYADGAGECGIPSCSLYPYNPYNPNKRVKKKTFTLEQRKAQSERMKAMNKSRGNT